MAEEDGRRTEAAFEDIRQIMQSKDRKIMTQKCMINTLRDEIAKNRVDKRALAKAWAQVRELEQSLQAREADVAKNELAYAVQKKELADDFAATAAVKESNDNELKVMIQMIVEEKRMFNERAKEVNAKQEEIALFVHRMSGRTSAFQPPEPLQLLENDFSALKAPESTNSLRIRLGLTSGEIRGSDSEPDSSPNLVGVEEAAGEKAAGEEAAGEEEGSEDEAVGEEAAEEEEEEEEAAGEEEEEEEAAGEEEAADEEEEEAVDEEEGEAADEEEEGEAADEEKEGEAADEEKEGEAADEEEEEEAVEEEGSDVSETDPASEAGEAAAGGMEDAATVPVVIATEVHMPQATASFVNGPGHASDVAFNPKESYIIDASLITFVEVKKLVDARIGLSSNEAIEVAEKFCIPLRRAKIAKDGCPYKWVHRRPNGSYRSQMKKPNNEKPPIDYIGQWDNPEMASLVCNIYAFENYPETDENAAIRNAILANQHLSGGVVALSSADVGSASMLEHDIEGLGPLAPTAQPQPPLQPSRSLQSHVDHPPEAPALYETRETREAPGSGNGSVGSGTRVSSRRRPASVALESGPRSAKRRATGAPVNVVGDGEVGKVGEAGAAPVKKRTISGLRRKLTPHEENVFNNANTCAEMFKTYTKLAYVKYPNKRREVLTDAGGRARAFLGYGFYFTTQQVNGKWYTNVWGVGTPLSRMGDPDHCIFEDEAAFLRAIRPAPS